MVSLFISTCRQSLGEGARRTGGSLVYRAEYHQASDDLTECVWGESFIKHKINSRTSNNGSYITSWCLLMSENKPKVYLK